MIFVAFTGHGQSVPARLSRLPANKSPLVVGKKVAERFLVTPHPIYAQEGVKPHITYFEVCTWYGALRFAKETGDTALLAKLVDRFKPLLGVDSALIPAADHVDFTVFGTIPSELYLQTKQTIYREVGKYFADMQWASPPLDNPKVTPQSIDYYNQGLTWQTRLWIDDMYMITLVQAQAYRATGDRKYIDRAAKEMVFYLDTLQRSNGLFYHAPAVPFFWGRGNGWMAAGMTELLRALPEDNSDRPRILAGYKKMMASLLKFQSANGMWRQLVDDPGSWPETSSTGMFTYAMITGVGEGWLDRRVYTTAARKAWLALTSYINENAEIREVCEGTGAKNDRQYYLDRARKTGDFHGQAPILWCASALIAYEQLKEIIIY